MPDISDDLIPATPRKPDWERAILENVAMASIREQQANRRWKTFVRMAWLLFFATLERRKQRRLAPRRWLKSVITKLSTLSISMRLVKQ